MKDEEDDSVDDWDEELEEENEEQWEEKETIESIVLKMHKGDRLTREDTFYISQHTSAFLKTLDAYKRADPPWHILNGKKRKRKRTIERSV